MNGTLTTAVLGGVMLLFALSTPLWARTDADEAQLETTRKEIDRDSTRGEAGKIQLLAEQFNVEPGTVETLRANKRGWGETAIELSMAQQLMQTDAMAYPTMTEALNRIETLRSQKMGWGKIANYFGFKLGPVVSSAQHVRNELRHETSPAGTSNVGMSGKSATATRVERAARPERMSRPERPARPERAARVH